MVSQRATRHKSDQLKLVRLLRRELPRIVIPQRSRGGIKGVLDALVALTVQYNRASASLASTYFEEERAATGFFDDFTIPMLPEPDEDRLARGLGWSTRDLADHAVDLDAVLNRVDGVASDYALEGGRDTVATSAYLDKQCLGYVRVPSADACAFCAILGLKVADGKSTYQLYKSRETAQRRGEGQTEDKYHDFCRCAVQAVFKGEQYVRPAHVERFAEIYADLPRGLKGKETLAAYRAAIAAERRAAS